MNARADDGEAAPAATATLFVYGTLMSEEVLRTLLGRVPRMRAGKLRGYERWCVAGQTYPAILQSTDTDAAAAAAVDGQLLEGLVPRELRALDYYEDDGYVRSVVTVTAADAQAVQALVYSWPPARAKMSSPSRARRGHIRSGGDSI